MIQEWRGLQGNQAPQLQFLAIAILLNMREGKI